MQETTDMYNGGEHHENVRPRSEQMAETLAREAMERGWTVFTGIVALPVAAALGVASGAMFGLSFVERCIALFQVAGERHGAFAFGRHYEAERGGSSHGRVSPPLA